MTKKTKVIVLLLTLFPFQSLAQGKVSPLEKGDPAPYAGILFSPEAAAKVTAEKESIVKICDADKAALSSKIRAECGLEKSKLRIELDHQEKVFKSRLGLKEKENDILTKQLKKLNKGGYSHWWYTGGVVTGVGVTLAIFKIAVELRK